MSDALPSRRQTLWVIPLAFALHSAEEAATFPAYHDLLAERLPESLRAYAYDIQPHAIRIALLWVTLFCFIAVLVATWRPTSTTALSVVLTIQAVVGINIVWHLAVAALIVRGYTPGIVSAICVNAPLSIYVFRRAAREHWVSPRAGRGILFAAAVIHGPGLPAVLFALRGR